MKKEDMEIAEQKGLDGRQISRDALYDAKFG